MNPYLICTLVSILLTQFLFQDVPDHSTPYLMLTSTNLETKKAFTKAKIKENWKPKTA